ncbi:MAG TPA: GNAT family N-acetyltransferase [Chryseolinea sp.]
MNNLDFVVTSFVKNIRSALQPFTTRKANLDDVAILVKVSVKTFRDTFAEVNTKEDMKAYLAKAFSRDQLIKELNDPASTFLLALDGDTVVGYAKLKEGEGPSELNGERGIEIERIYTLKDYLGKRVGKLLMQTCLDLAAERGYKLAWLGVWEYNPRAIAFYEKWGFKKFGSHPFLLGNDLQTDLLMKKKLD